MTITSTVYALEAGSRILWGGNAGDIVGIHEWTFTETPSGTDVTTNESFGGATVAKYAANMQTLLDQSLVHWLQRLKATAESRRSRPRRARRSSHDARVTHGLLEALRRSADLGVGSR